MQVYNNLAQYVTLKKLAVEATELHCGQKETKLLRYQITCEAKLTIEADTCKFAWFTPK